MDDERLDELRDQAKHLIRQIDVLREAEQLVRFFSTLEGELSAGLALRMDSQHIQVCRATGGTGSSGFCPTGSSDAAEQLWPKFKVELHAKLYAEMSQMLWKYTEKARALRDKALCGVCGAPDGQATGIREPRGVRIREKHEDSDVSE